MSVYLVNSTLISLGGIPSVQRGGTLLTDAAIISAVQAAGGCTVPSTDVAMTAAYNVAQYMLSTGQDEAHVDRVMIAALAAAAFAGTLQHMQVDLPLATIQAKTSGVAFNIGAALPAGAVVQDYDINVVAEVTGGTLSAVHATVQNTAETAGALIASTDVFGTLGVQKIVGSNPYGNRGGQQLQATLTAVGDTLADATAGHIQVDIYYTVAQ
jgi:hypothetical protein